MTQAAVQRIVVVGGGLAGWTAAAAFSSSLKGMPVSIVVIDLPGLVNIEPVQYTLPQTLTFFRHVGIDENELIRRTGATFRLGTELIGWRAPGDACIRAYGRYGADIGFIPFHHYAAKRHLSGDATDYADYSPAAVAARSGRFARTGPGAGKGAPALEYGLQLNTDKLIELLRSNATINGAGVLPARVEAVSLDGDTGFIDAVRLADGRRVSGDLFVDASGDAALLTGAALGIGFDDWSRWLPCDRTASVTLRDHGSKPPMLAVFASDGGWLLRSSLRHRTAWQLLYASGHLDDEGATARLMDRLPDTGAADALTFGDSRSGQRLRFWAGNCLAVGSSAGHIEALETTAFHLVQSAVLRFLRLFPPARFEPRLADEYNRETTEEYEGLRDCVLVNYLAAGRRDSGSRYSHRLVDLPESLQRRIELFRSRGRFVPGENETLTRDSWIALLLSAGFWPQGYDPLLDVMEASQLITHFSDMLQKIELAVSAMPAHADVLSGLDD